ncbi:fungal-specific transcription factor domain-containing protein [Emericellopsis atlantica]|uniref:Fungal-specific transcription factor domain-containing protein n=1 Tax=Emericellopsis atlantica TaxID=2614577 RepID=A0A9P7ZPV9_9HYPO|nr:fungal-specific transcription factor domain-containing protein [Emericellopsis atlantica]KAG9255617.1 fungal-specific transcription factor domain-containing protein [Emericellopsis atlantica]
MATNPIVIDALPEPTVEPASARRKACDLCFTKKIKCDMLKPVCSNCKLYNADCQTTSVARKRQTNSRPKQAVKIREAETKELAEENESLKKRLARIEEQLQQILEAAKQEHALATASAPVSSTNGSTPEELARKCSPEELKGPSAWRFDPVEPSLYHGPGDDDLPLPPLDQLMPYVDHYFNTFNRALPLFDQAVFMRMMRDWHHTDRPKRDRAIWAAILMVCAMGLRSPIPGDEAPTIDQRARTDWANRCMRNAQSVMSELVTREKDLLGVQVLLSLVCLFHNSSDSRPASVLVGTAVRLAQRLQLHSNASSRLYAPGEVLLRHRVFWIAYLFDKDLSLRGQAPSAQQDADIDISLPPMNPPDGAGLIYTSDKKTCLNTFRIRLGLSHIQGKIFDNLYSNRASKVQGAERRQRIAALSTMLEQWYARIPPAFRIEHVSSTVDESELVQMVKLHHAYLLAVVHTHGIYSHESEWFGRISSMSKAMIQDYAMTILGPTSKRATESQEPPMAQGWKQCVDLSRKCIRLFQDATPTECLIWQCSCAHFSGLIVLLANNLMHPTHPDAWIDQELSNKAVKLLNDLVSVLPANAFDTLCVVVNELQKKASTAVDAARLAAAQTDWMQASDGNLLLEDLGDEMGFPVFADDEDITGAFELDDTWDHLLSNDNAVVGGAEFQA